MNNADFDLRVQVFIRLTELDGTASLPDDVTVMSFGVQSCMPHGKDFGYSRAQSPGNVQNASYPRRKQNINNKNYKYNVYEQLESHWKYTKCM